MIMNMTMKGQWMLNIITEWVWMYIATGHVVEQFQLGDVRRNGTLPTLDKVNPFVPASTNIVYILGCCISRKRGCQPDWSNVCNVCTHCTVISFQRACLRGVGQSVWIWSWPPMFCEMIRICGLSARRKTLVFALLFKYSNDQIIKWSNVPQKH